jgi:hypothetical protein
VLSASVLEIVRATDADIPYVMATERTPGYEVFIGRWEHEQHARALADGRHAYFLGRRAGTGRLASPSYETRRPSTA